MDLRREGKDIAIAVQEPWYGPLNTVEEWSDIISLVLTLFGIGSWVPGAEFVGLIFVAVAVAVFGVFTFVRIEKVELSDTIELQENLEIELK